MTQELKQIRADVRELLEVNERGVVRKTRRNCMTVLECDPVLKGKLKKNLLTGRVDVVGETPWRNDTNTLEDDDLHQIYLILEEYEIVGADKLVDSAVRLVAADNEYHPIRDRLEALVWDGTPCVADAMRHFLGVEKSSLSEEEFYEAITNQCDAEEMYDLRYDEFN